jgi:hypothetical protein
MEEDRMAEKIFTQDLEGTRRRRKPRKGWKEEVERDLQVLGLRRWKDLVKDRKKGRIFFYRPKPTAGCSANETRRIRRRRRRRNNLINVPFKLKVSCCNSIKNFG